MIGTMGTLTPLLKLKADELFLQWFLKPETQKQLQEDFRKIKNLESPPSSPKTLVKCSTNTNSLGSRPASPPATPPLSSTPPGKLALSPRRRTLSSVSSSSQTDGPCLRKSSTKSRASKQKKKQVVPGCAKNLPQFYFPFGRPMDDFVDEKAKVRLISRIFAKATNGKADISHFVDVVQVCRNLYAKLS